MKTMKRIVAVMMTVLMLVSTVSIGMTFTAASKKKVSKIKLNKTSVTIYVGDTHKLKATVSPSNASNKKVSWSSSNKKVATVSSSGKVTAKKAGKATITVKAKDGSGKKTTCKVTVKKPTKVKKIELNKSSVKLTEGKTLTLKATISPSKATNKNVTWSSSNKKVATVSSKGKITAKKAGTATITCKAKDGSGKKDTVKVTVTKKKTVKVTSVELDRNALTLTQGKTYTLSVDISPSKATNKKVNWKSSDTSVATVSSSGKITAKGVGTAKITATAADGSGEKDTCRVTVNPVLVTGISLSKTRHEGEMGTGFTLTATVSPSNAGNKKVIWSSSDTSVATVSSTGAVKLVGSGEATIIAEAADDSGESASCQVIVKDIMVTGITLSQTSYSGGPGEAFYIVATVSPSNATNKGLVWQSSNPSVAVVSNGNVALMSPGTAQIIATPADGSSVMAICSIKVDTTEVKSITLSATELTATPGWQGDTLTATVSPSYAFNKRINWTSDDRNVATVNEYGEITYVGVGETTIRATAADGSGATAACKVKVVESIPVTSIALSKTSVSGKVGTSFALNATVLPDRASNRTLSWKSNNNSVATVDSSGVVRFVGGGSAIITATATDGSGVSASCTVTSQAMVQEIGVYSTVSSWYVGKTGQIKVSVYPESASQDVIWTASDSEHVTIDSNGNLKIVKDPRNYFLGMDLGHKDLDVTITATARDGSGVQGQYKFTIKEKVDVTGVAFSANEYTTYVGQKFTPMVTVSPSDASEKDVIYTSSNPSVIKVEDGKLVAVGQGNATITAKSADKPNLTATAKFAVLKPNLYLMGETNVSYYSAGDVIKLQAIWQPEGVVNDLGMKILIEDESILRHVSSEKTGLNYTNLYFELLKEGVTSVKITTNDGSISSENVEVKVRGVAVDDYHDGLRAGDIVSLNPTVMISEPGDCYCDDMKYEVPAEFREYFEITEKGVRNYDVKIIKALPEDGAYITFIPDPANKPDFRKNVYFSADEYEVVAEKDALRAMKTYIQTVTSVSSTRDKVVNYNNINILNADLKLSSKNLITNGMLQAGLSGATSEELGADEMIYNVFGESKTNLGESVSKGPLAITVNESDVESVDVIDNGGVTYQLVLKLGVSPKLSVSAVGSSVYAKAMPVIDASAVASFKNELHTTMGGTESFALEEVNEGTMEQTYRDGKIVLTINKLTDKVESCDYYFVSDTKMTDANIKVSMTLDLFGKIDMNTIATFTMSVEEKISFYDFKY